MRRRYWLMAGAVLGAVAVVTFWQLWPAGADPQVEHIRSLQNELFAQPPKTREEFVARRDKFTELRKEVDALSPEQRRELMRTPPPMAKMIQKEVAAYHALPKEERRQFLDKKIDEMEQMRKNMQQMFAGGGGPPGGGPSGGPGGPGGGPGGPGGGPGGPGGPPPPGSDRPTEMRDAILNNTSAQQRGQMTEFMRDMQERRQERGMAPLPPPPF